MKNSLASVDINILTRELSMRLDSAWVDKVYQLSEREIKIRVRLRNEGVGELLFTPNYFCLTSYVRETPEQPTSFAMLLRKHLRGATICSIRQHEFDRIIEINMWKDGCEFTLVVELFSKGNIILCDNQHKIIGLLEKQTWRDRTLKVDEVYAYPPSGRNPLLLSEKDFFMVLSRSDRSVVAFLAIELGLGGTYAEELCLLSGVKKEKKAKELTEEEKVSVFSSIRTFLDKLGEAEIESAIVYEDGNPIDVVPFPLRIYETKERRFFTSFNEAVDTYFSIASLSEKNRDKEKSIKEKIEALEEIEKNQRQTIEGLEKKAIEYQRIGDIIYQHFHSLSRLLAAIEEERKTSDLAKIREKIKGKSIEGIRLIDVKEDGMLLVEVDD